jgi:hypothetical protein
MAKKKKARQNEAVANSAEPSKTDGSITNEELAQKVIEDVKQAKVTAEKLNDLRNRFAALKKGETILGYGEGQWEKFCREKLGMTASKARRWIRETCKAIGIPTPGSKHDGSANRVYNHGAAPWHHTPDGTTVDVARSAAQKTVRDGDEVQGLRWLRQLYFAGCNVGKALAIFVSEEIGLADTAVWGQAKDMLALADRCKPDHVPSAKCLEGGDKSCENRGGHPDLLHYNNAMMLCCRAPKLRAADNAAIWLRTHTFNPPTPEEIKAATETAKATPPVIPEKVYDKHTSEGRRRGRGMEHFLTEGAALQNKSDVLDFQPPKLCPHCGGTGRVAD